MITWFEERREVRNGVHPVRVVAHLHQDKKYLYRVLVYVGEGVGPTERHYIIGRRNWARWFSDHRISTWENRLRGQRFLSRIIP